MKTFIVLNGNKATVIERTSMEEAKNHCVNYCDHSKEVIVRQISNFSYAPVRVLKTMKLKEELSEEISSLNEHVNKLKLQLNAISSIVKEFSEYMDNKTVNIDA